MHIKKFRFLGLLPTKFSWAFVTFASFKSFTFLHQRMCSIMRNEIVQIFKVLEQPKCLYANSCCEVFEWMLIIVPRDLHFHFELPRWWIEEEEKDRFFHAEKKEMLKDKKDLAKNKYILISWIGQRL